MSSSAPAYWLNDASIEASIKCAVPWWNGSILNDPLQLKDVRARPDLIARAVRRRAERGWIFGTPHRMVVPKPNGLRRVMTAFDPIADIGYRQIVGRTVPAIAASLSPSVYSSRPVVVGQSWCSEGWQHAHRQFVSDVAMARADDRWAGVGHLDVADQFPTTSSEPLSRVLNTAGCSNSAVEHVVSALEGLAEFFGEARGLPVGPEASAPLGTIALVPLDRLLTGLGVTYFRWADDFEAFLPHAVAYDTVQAALGDLLARGGQSLHPTKCRYESLHAVVQETGSAYVDDTESFNLANASQALADAAERHDPTDVRRALGQLRAEHDDTGVATLLADGWIIERFPLQAAQYLGIFHSSIPNWEPLIDLCLDETTDDRAAAQLRVTRLLTKKQIGKNVGRQFFDKALSLSKSAYSPLINELFSAAGRSREAAHVRRNRAIEYAVELGDLNARRALLATFIEGSLSKPHRVGIKHLVHCDPDLEATAEFVLA